MQEAEEKIEQHYDTWAEEYSSHSRLASERARELASLLHRHVWLLPGEGWASIGCRSGETLAEVAERELVRPSGHWGFDPSERMVSLARDHYPRLAGWSVAEADNIPLKDGQARGAIVNGGWQWIHRESGISASFAEARRILRQNSLLAIAHPGQGTDQALLGAARETTLQNPAWVEKEMPENPLGASSLQEMLEEADRAGFRAVHGQEKYDPVMYSNLSLYLEEIEYTSQAAWVLHFQKQHWQDAWEEICERLSEHTTDGFSREVFSIYLLLRAV
jgi:SAM-dependent methyltransferase